MTPDDASALVTRLRAHHATGVTRPYEWRADQLHGVRRFLDERGDDIAAAVVSDLRRAPFDAWSGEVLATKAEVKHALKHLRSWMRPTRAALPRSLRGRASYAPEPLGTVLIIGPWNYPVGLSLSPLVGALAAGNAVILKPSEQAPTSSALLARALPDYLDRDAFAVVEGDGQATQHLIDARVDLIFFTGGTEIGRKVMGGAARHLTPVVLELGGKSPVIVTRQAELGVTARRVASGKLMNSGQVCLAPDYVLVEEAVRDAFVTELTSAIRQMSAKSPELQPIVNERQFERLAGLLSSGTTVLGGATGDRAIAPTVLLDPPADSPVMESEIFGPVLPVVAVRDLDEAIAWVNRGEKPLAAYLFSEDEREAQRVNAEVSAGAVVVNHTVVHVLIPSLPFGGVGESGMGAYHGKWGFDAFSHRKSFVQLRTRPDPKFTYPPHSERVQRLIRRFS